MKPKKLSWKAKAKESFPNLRPSRVGWYTLSQDGRALLVTALDAEAVVVFNNDGDLSNLSIMLELCMRNRGMK